MIAIPNKEKPKNAFDCSVKINPEERMCIYTGKIFEETLSLLLDRPCDDCPLIEIDESEMEYLYQEFGLEKDENLTVRAIELKYAILMGYAYAKREIVTCGECEHYAFGSCSKLHLVTGPENFCSDGERRNDE